MLAFPMCSDVRHAGIWGRQVLNVDYALEGDTRRWHHREGSGEAKLAQVETGMGQYGGPSPAPKVWFPTFLGWAV